MAGPPSSSGPEGERAAEDEPVRRDDPEVGIAGKLFQERGKQGRAGPGVLLADRRELGQGGEQLTRALDEEVVIGGRELRQPECVVPGLLRREVALIGGGIENQP
jgi:hypothetical protein